MFLSLTERQTSIFTPLKRLAHFLCSFNRGRGRRSRRLRRLCNSSSCLRERSPEFPIDQYFLASVLAVRPLQFSRVSTPTPSHTRLLRNRGSAVSFGDFTFPVTDSFVCIRQSLIPAFFFLFEKKWDRLCTTYLGSFGKAYGGHGDCSLSVTLLFVSSSSFFCPTTSPLLFLSHSLYHSLLLHDDTRVQPLPALLPNFTAPVGPVLFSLRSCSSIGVVKQRVDFSQHAFHIAYAQILE